MGEIFRGKCRRVGALKDSKRQEISFGKSSRQFGRLAGDQGVDALDKAATDLADVQLAIQGQIDWHVGLSALESAPRACYTSIVSACSLVAPHMRKRLYFMITVVLRAVRVMGKPMM